MKKQIFYGIAFVIFISEACQFKSTPKIGDAVLYEYVVKQGDSIVYKAARQIGDTATIILEDTKNSEPTKQELVERIMKMSENDSLSFDLNNNQKGFVRLYKIIPAIDFPKYVEEGNKRQMIFDQRLQEIKKELIASLPSYQNRQKTVVDSAKMLSEQYKKGQINDKLNKLGSDDTYFVVKGNGKIQPEKKKWVWFHYVAITPDNKIMDSYKNAPKCTNLSEFPLDEALEKGAGSFEEGSIILLTVPFTNSIKTAKDSAVSNKTMFWIEVVKVLYL
jgi:hypothetical protein